MIAGLDPLPLHALVPELLLVLAMFAMLGLDLLRAPALRDAGPWLGGVACLVGACLALPSAPTTVGTMLTIDGLAGFARALGLGVAGVVLLAAAGRARTLDQPGAWAMGVVALALGTSLAAMASNLLPLWLGLELIAMASYTLVAFGGERRAAEAGMKFVLFGGVASALMLYGASHAYGLTGSFEFASLRALLGGAFGPAGTLALLLAGTGLAYKLSLVPFHFYAPDVYQGAPPLGIAAVSVMPKIGAAVALLHFLTPPAPLPAALPFAVATSLAALAAVSALVGAFVAVVQRDGKRILAFSGVGHGGAIVLAIACGPSADAAAAVGFYLLTYGLANVGAFVCLAVLVGDRGSTQLEALAGAWRQRPVVASLLCLFVMSLAGIPPLAGFLGKWGVLQQAFGRAMASRELQPLGVAALLLLLASVVGAWSYLLIVRAVVLAPAPSGEAPPREPLALPLRAALAVCALAVVGLGVWLAGFDWVRGLL